MAYINCPKCGSINRDSDANCFSCQADLTQVAAPPPPPPPPPPTGVPGSATQFGDNAELSERELGSGNVDKPRFKDLASRYEARKLPSVDSTLLQGLRSGLIAGLVLGAIFGFVRTRMEDDTFRLLLHHIPTLHSRKPLDILIYSLVMDGGFGLLLGGFLGLTNRLCFTPESSKVGAVLGAVGGGLVVYLAPHPGFETIAIGLANGYAMAVLASLLERKIFR